MDFKRHHYQASTCSKPHVEVAVANPMTLVYPARWSPEVTAGRVPSLTKKPLEALYP